MDFTVKYRSTDGSTQTAIISAPNRPEVSAICKSRGMTTVSIKETVGRANGGSLSCGQLYFAIFTITAVIIAGAGMWWMLSDGCVADVLDQKLVKTKTKKIAKQESPLPKLDKSEPTLSPKCEQKLTPDEKRAKRREEILANIRPPIRKDIEERPDGSFLYTDSKGRRICCLQKHAVIDEQNRFKSPFKHRVEAYLSNFAIPGQSIPPMPHMKFSLEELQSALDETIVVDMGKDDEELIAKKQNVQQLKIFLKEALAQGMSFEEFVQRLEERQHKEAVMVQESRKLILQTLADGKREEAKELLAALNRNLNGNGIPNLRLPAKYRRMMEE